MRCFTCQILNKLYKLLDPFMGNIHISIRRSLSVNILTQTWQSLSEILFHQCDENITLLGGARPRFVRIAYFLHLNKMNPFRVVFFTNLSEKTIFKYLRGVHTNSQEILFVIETFNSLKQVHSVYAGKMWLVVIFT